MKKLFLIFLAVSLPFLAFSKESKLPTLKVTYNEAELNYDSYIDGTVEVADTDGSEMKLNAIFKTRGATARHYPIKPSLNMKLRDEGGEELDVNLLGLREASSFILDAMAIDRINMRNRVAFDIWNEFSSLPYETDFDGRNGTVGKFIELYINGKYKGIYCLSDKINRKLLGLKKPKTNADGSLQAIRGVLYKNGTNDLDDQNTPGLYNGGSVYVAQSKDAWELHEPEEFAGEEVWKPLQDLYKDNNYLKFQYIKEHFYLQNLADFAIHLMALSIIDNWGNKNRYLSIVNCSGTGDDTRFVITPWDLDTSFGGSFNGENYDGDYLEWSVADIMNRVPIPYQSLIDRQEFLDMLKSTWERGRKGALSVESVQKRLRDACTLFVESGAWQRTVELWPTQKEQECYVEDLEKEIELICKWYEDRFAMMDEYFGITDADNNAVEGIEADSDQGNHIIYNLQGVPQKEMVTPGIYIQNGKKKVIN